MPNKLPATVRSVTDILRISSPQGALVAALLSVLLVSTATPLRAQSSNTAGNTETNPAPQVSSTEPATQDPSDTLLSADADPAAAASADDSLPPREEEPPLEQTSTAQTYQPSESISEDSSVSFPVDI